METATLENVGVTNTSECNSKTLKLDSYINAINYANFTGEPLRVMFRHRVFARELVITALPSPCTNENLELEWEDTHCDEKLEQFECLKILIPNGDDLLSAVPCDYSLTPAGMTVLLPESAYVLNNREEERYSGKDIDVTLLQNGSFHEGRLVDFNPRTLLITIEKDENPELKWINREEDFQVLLKKDRKAIYTGPCTLLSSREKNGTTFHIFQILKSEITRFKKKHFRGERFELLSPLQASFIHPLSEDKCIIPVTNISGSGFCLKEEEAFSVLIPGMMIPEMELDLPGGRPLKCRTQVIYRRKDEETGNGHITCGIAILDMGPEDHALLLNFVHQENDSHAFVCNRIDTSNLWQFFFESGFIYPEKYKYLSGKKETIKDLYDRLYTKSPGIARHFIYQEGNRIQGHMSMLRSYENSWLLHHHAASTTHSHNAGLHVLNQVGSFTNNSHRIESLHMHYLICYYREENKFPRRVFGDIAKNNNNPKECSIDVWEYFHYQTDQNSIAPLPEGWTLEESTGDDLKNLTSFYNERSGGLMVKALNLSEGRHHNRSLFEEYKQCGFNRKIELFSTMYRNECRGIIMADLSETGLNMSNLTNSLKIFIINPAGFTCDIINHFMHDVSGLFSGEDRIPVLVYPEGSAEKLGISKEKNYTLWILNTEAGDAYFKYLKTLLKRIHH